LPCIEQLQYDSGATMLQPIPFPAGVPTRVLKTLCMAVALAPLAACGRSEPAGPPVATPSLALSREKAAIGSPVELTYRFEVAQDATFDRDYYVFVHVLDPDGEQLWTDDHLPPTPTSQWTPGQTIAYTRTVFVPNYPYIGPAEVRLGMYAPEENRRLVLGGTEVSRREYRVARLELLPQSENVFLIHKDGWHDVETDVAAPSTEWRWTGQRAVTAFRNPKRDSTIYLEYDARADRFDTPQQVTLRAGDQVVATFAADSRDRTLLKLPVSAQQLGDSPMVDLVIAVDRAFQPEGGDPRELGIRIFHLFVQPN
jgi:hypothetical protein